jgi:hypothetical protein
MGFPAAGPASTKEYQVLSTRPVNYPQSEYAIADEVIE